MLTRFAIYPFRFLPTFLVPPLATRISPPHDVFKLSMSTTATPPTTAYDWCCTAAVDFDTHEVRMQKLVGYKDTSVNALQTMDGREKPLDLTKSPDWMEYIEITEDRIQDEGGAGAYDTMRCDLVVDSESADERWRIWGEEFHLCRLENSFRSLIHEQPEQENGGANDGHTKALRRQSVWEVVTHTAMKDSHKMIQTLLGEAEKAEIFKQNQLSSNQQWEDVLVQPVRLSLLWSLPKGEHSNQRRLVVRGHACSSTKPVLIHRPVKPIVTTIAALCHKDGGHKVSCTDISVDKSMPTRLLDPQHKVASWTRLRKKMENPETYMPAGVSEVLMVRESKQGLEVLEGLSSNLFVIYKDGTIRTAADGVLFGYVRHLVLECAEACGLKLDTTRPILLKDAGAGLWKEAFITSSSRLIFPISKVMIHTDDARAEFTEYWSDPVFTAEAQEPKEPPTWRCLLDEILKRGGYPRFC